MPPRPHILILDRAAFVAVYGGVWEHSPWIAEQTWARGLTEAEDTADGLHAAMVAVLDRADRAAKLALLNAHPDLAGRVAIAGGLTTDSRKEQSGAGLDQCTPDEFVRFQDLNAAYKARFGFPFIIAVKGRLRSDILDAFGERIANDHATEFATALNEVKTIALLRLRDLMP